jgi:PAS domain S-box-containing protein
MMVIADQLRRSSVRTVDGLISVGRGKLRETMFSRLQTKLTVLYAGLFAVALALVFLAVYGAVNDNARHVVKNDLTAGGAVFDRLRAIQSDQLGQAAAVLARDFGFRAAVATADKPTTQSALENLRGRFNLDLALLVGLDGQVISAGDAPPAAVAAELHHILADDDQASGVFTIGGVPYEAVATPVQSPTTVGWVVFAKKLDREQMAGLERLSAIPIDAMVLTRSANGMWEARTSATRAADTAPLSRFVTTALAGADGKTAELVTSDGRALALVKPLKSMNAGQPAVLLLRYPLARALAPYQSLLIVILLMSIAGMALLLIGSWLLARSLTRPISALEEAAQQLQQGQAVTVLVNSNDEIGRLSSSFNQMAATIRERETELSSTKAFIDGVVENLPAMVVVKDVNHRFVLINKAGEDLIGVNREDFLGKTDHDLFPPEQADFFVERDRAVLESGLLEVIADEPIQTRDNGLRYLQTKKIAINGEDGRPQYLVCISDDITERKIAAVALEAALVEAEAANRAKSSFLTNMSHEVRTPLNGLVGVAGMLQATGLNARQSDMVAIIETSAQILERVLSDVIDLAQLESGRVEFIDKAFDLKAGMQLLGAQVEPLAAGKGLVFDLEIAADVGDTVQGDRIRLQQVLTNLLNNALKFTETGRVGLRISRPTPGGDAVAFEVHDTGVGFDPRMAETLFERFRQADGSATRQFGGTGLGLSISRDLARGMGGDVTARGAPGEGACFTLVVPLKAVEAPVSVPAAPVPPLASAEDEADARPVRVLLTDDNAINRKVAAMILDAVGAQIVHAENGEEALLAFQAQAFDVVLMDLQMPVMDGLTAIQLMRGHEANTGAARTPILVLSANALPEHREAAAVAGADAHLPKPVTAPVLLSALDEALTAADAARSNAA